MSRRSELSAMDDHRGNIIRAKMVAADCIADSTQDKYVTSFQKWRQYCRQHSVACWKATPDDVIGYLDSFRQRHRSCKHSTVYQHLSAIAYMYRLKGLVSPTTDPLVSMYMKGVQRHEKNAKIAPKQARPMTTEILIRLNTYLYQRPRSLRVWRSVWRINAAFYGLLRWDDVRRLQVKDFEMQQLERGPQYAFTLQGGKTLMYEKDQSRCLYSTHEAVRCPVILTQRYFEFLGTSWQGSVVPQCDASNRNRPHPKRVLSYTNAKEDLQYVLALIGEDPRGFSEHSMRRGGATEAARLGAPPDEIQAAGNWSNLRTASRYVDHPQQRNRVLEKYLK